MTSWQKAIQYLSIAFAILLIVGIFSGILAAVSAFGGIDPVVSSEKGDAVLAQAETYTVSQDITQIDIQIRAAALSITEADAFRVESNLKNLTVSDKDGVLRITEGKRSLFSGVEKGVVTLYIPSSATLQRVDIETGAGTTSVAALTTEYLSLDLGAGRADLCNLTARLGAEIDGGAGAMTVSGGTLHNLELDIGVGKADITAALTGKSKVSCGVGATEITLTGDKNSYTVRVDKGLGKATVDGNDMGDGSTYGNGENRVDIDGGVGSLKVSFR